MLVYVDFLVDSASFDYDGVLVVIVFVIVVAVYAVVDFVVLVNEIIHHN